MYHSTSQVLESLIHTKSETVSKCNKGCVVGVSVTKKLSRSLLQTGVCSLVPTTVSQQRWYSVQQRFLLFNTACVTCNARKQTSACLEYRRIGRYPIYFHPWRRPESGLTISSFMLFFPPAYTLRSSLCHLRGKKMNWATWTMQSKSV